MLKEEGIKYQHLQEHLMDRGLVEEVSDGDDYDTSIYSH